MISILKNILRILITPALIMALVTNSMEKPTNYPQLQLNNPTNNPIPVDCSITLIHGLDPVQYTDQVFHTIIFKENNLQSNIKDPVVLFEITETSSGTQLSLGLPAKHCLNLNDGSLLQIIKTNEQLASEFPPLFFKNKLLLLNARCVKNPNLPGKNFAEQMNNAKKKFYENPTGSFITKDIFTENNILEITKEDRLATFCEFKQGLNGCSSEKILIKSAIATKISEKTSYFKALRNRELTGSFRK